MPEPNYKTVRLSRGKHQSPDKGVCVMELASMLAHEPFSDHPSSVCPVIAGFLRTYNDSVEDQRRQELYRYASLAIGTRGEESAEHRRAELCIEFAERRQRRRGVLGVRLLPKPWGKLAFPQQGKAEASGVSAARAAAKHSDDESHRATLSFLDELIASGRDAEEALAPTPARALESTNAAAA